MDRVASWVAVSRRAAITPAMQQTKVDAALAALEEQYADQDPERAELLRRTRRFKASWLELAQALTDARRNGHHQKWGYDAFEDYTRLELKLRPETVDKLTASYSFLHKRAPDVLRRDPLDMPMPSYQSIDFLRRAEERAEEHHDVPDEAMTDLRKRVLEDGAPIATVSRLYKDRLFPVSDAEKLDKDRAALRATASKLKDMLADTKAVPRGVAEEAAAAVGRVLDALGEASPKAA